MDLNSLVAAWDGKSVSTISQIYHDHKNTAEFGRHLINCLGDAESERGVTWLIKHHLEQGWMERGEGPNTNETAAMIKALPTLTHWEARLHLLQSLDHFEIPKSSAAPLATFLETAIKDNAKFVRAWAYHGWYVLADQHPTYLPQATALLEEAQSTESAASVKVKVRKALQNLG